MRLKGSDPFMRLKGSDPFMRLKGSDPFMRGAAPASAVRGDQGVHDRVVAADHVEHPPDGA
jgi:hypothetical protein